MTATIHHLPQPTPDRRARFLPRRLVLETAAFFRAEGYEPADLGFIPASPGRKAVMAEMERRLGVS